MTSSCILLVIGPPASGKSSLCRHLTISWSHIYDVTHVEYDVICEPAVVMDESMTTSWRELRRVALERVETSLSQSSSDKPTVVLVDDTMHLRSMRYQCFQLARRKAVGFAVVYVKQDLSCCLTHNTANPNRRRLDDSMIKQVFSRFEPPTGKWEANSVEVTPTDWRNCEAIVQTIGQLVDRTLVIGPPAPLIDLSLAADQSRRICSTNERHQLDCALRRLVREHVGGMGDRAKSANQARRNVMMGVVKGSVQIPIDFSSNYLDLKARDLFFTELSLVECMNT